MSRVFGKKAFTLVELLVVISIIALLLGVLMPGLQKARDYARRTYCANNTRQINQAFNIYASGNGGEIPINKGRSYWLWDLSYHTTDLLEAGGATRETFYCPSHPTKQADDDRAWRYTESYPDGADAPMTRADPEPTGSARFNHYRHTLYVYAMEAIDNQGRSRDERGMKIYKNYYDSIKIAGRRVSLRPSGREKEISFIRNLSKVKHPSERVLVADTIVSSTERPRRWSDWQAESAPGVGGHPAWGWDNVSNHRDSSGFPQGGNVSFIDGSTRWRDFEGSELNYRTNVGPYWWW